jgi:pimeloyl-ACP methyl ester carboxylesterase
MKPKRILRKTFLFLAIVLIGWIIFAQSCMKFRISDSQAQEQFNKAGVRLFTETVKINGFPIHYAKTGNDSFPTLLFVHGSPGSWNAFEHYMKDPALLQKFRMISIDRPGFGYSRFGHAKNLEEQSVLLSPLLALINNNKPVYAIGHSLGGPMVLKLDLDNPGYFSGMVLLAASVDPAAEKPEKWRRWLYGTPLNLLVPGAFAPSNKELWFLKKDLVLLQQNLGKITCPVWIIHGDKDGFVPVANVDFLKQKLVNSDSVEVKILQGANHFIPWAPWSREITAVLMKLGSSP